MSEETENEGTWSGLKKTIIGTISTAILAGGTYLTTQLFGGGYDEGKPKTEQAAPAQAPVINLSVDNSSQNNSSNGGGGTTTVIKEKTVEKAAPAAPAKPEKKSESEDAPW